MEQIRFFLPGPTYCPEDIRRAMVAPSVAHRSEGFKRLYAAVAERLRKVFRTENDVMVATSSATMVMESAVLSTVLDSMLSLTAGAFSERWHAISLACGKEADRVSVPWGSRIDPDLVAVALRKKRYDAVSVVHSETSTGVLQPLEELARVVRQESDALLLVDAVSSLAGAAVETDEWQLDVVLTASQKALALPPGLAIFSLSERAARRAERVRHRGFYTDLLRYRDKHRAGGTITTPALPQFYALDAQLDRVLQEGLENRWARHLALRNRTEEWAASRGFEFASAPGSHSPTVSCLRPPQGVKSPWLVERLGAEGFVVGGGYGDWKKTTFRIGHMGEIRGRDLERLLVAIDEVLDGV